MKVIRLYTILVFSLIVPFSAGASDIYLESEIDKFGPGDNFSVDIKIDSKKKCVNAVDVSLIFPLNHLRVKDFLTGDSILNLWIDKPNSENFSESNQTGVLHFSGGTPGGYCGLIPGDPGESNILGRVIFESPAFVIGERGEREISIDVGVESRVLLNDGLGTEDSLKRIGLDFLVLDSPTLSQSNYIGQLRNDRIPPESFIIYVQGGNSAFNGANYVEFNTVDKQTGVDHYEILEIWGNDVIGVPSKRTVLDFFFKSKRVIPEWETIKSPYLLVDQDLRSIIRLKAVDKAGNERMVEYIPSGSISQQQSQILYRWFYVIIVVLVVTVIVLLFLWLFWRKLKGRKKGLETEVTQEHIDDKQDERRE